MDSVRYWIWLNAYRYVVVTSRFENVVYSRSSILLRMKCEHLAKRLLWDNAILSSHHLIECSDEAFVLDNEALFEICQETLKMVTSIAQNFVTFGIFFRKLPPSPTWTVSSRIPCVASPAPYAFPVTILNVPGFFIWHTETQSIKGSHLNRTSIDYTEIWIFANFYHLQEDRHLPSFSCKIWHAGGVQLWWLPMFFISSIEARGTSSVPPRRFAPQISIYLLILAVEI